MKVFFDTNVYVAEALLGHGGTARLIEATGRAGWRMFVSAYVLDETARVIVDKLGFRGGSPPCRDGARSAAPRP